MTERPILFSGPMVQAILDGRKTQTRRVLKNQPGKFVHIEHDERKGWQYWWDVGTSGMPDVSQEYAPLKCPYGIPGDRLWVRETWQVDAPRDGTWADTQFYGCKGSPLSDIPAQYQRPEYCLFRASWTGTPIIWRPSIHMPRWACRTILEITEIRVQRLQEISEEDAKAEGVKVGVNCPDHIIAFGRLWESINGPGSWAENPWVWCVSFRKVLV